MNTFKPWAVIQVRRDGSRGYSCALDTRDTRAEALELAAAFREQLLGADIDVLVAKLTDMIAATVKLARYDYEADTTHDL